MSDLKPCPFCGSKAHTSLIQSMWFVECDNKDCGALMGFDAEKVSQEEAISAWNRRAQHAACEIAEYAEDCKDCGFCAQPANEPLTPCDACRYNPPSSCDGKPCVMCPASGKPEGR